jgi:hypothetical protein
MNQKVKRAVVLSWIAWLLGIRGHVITHRHVKVSLCARHQGKSPGGYDIQS